ncbi:MAG: hypothetical protein KC503_09670, partial [Myxococcales bacterium]|nr:hypothetical protein [Myxococcales bacterium]
MDADGRGNTYLDGLDHFVKRTLRIPGYLRYGDDCALFSDDRSHLVEARVAIVDWLQQHRRLEVNPRSGAVAPTRHPCLFLGCRICPAGIAPSRRAWRRMRSRLREAEAQGPEALARSIA